MDPQLLARRQVAADRHDAALNAFPRREGAEFQRELRAVIEELTAISAASDAKVSDPVERARTLTWLGSAYFDLGRGIDQQLLSESARCYLLAEELIPEEDSPLFKAKLAFNFANTLRGQSQGLDVGVLEAAEHRYEQAAAAFKGLGQLALAKQAQGNLDTLRTQLSLARARSKMGDELKTLGELKAALPGADAIERDAISGKVAHLRERPKDMVEAQLGVALEQLRQTVASRPELFDDGNGVLGDLAAQSMQLVSSMQGAAAPQTSNAELMSTVLVALKARLASDVEQGRVSQDRASSLHELLEQFAKAVAMPGDNLESVQRRQARLRELTERASAFALDSSGRSRAEATPGSRLSQLQALSLELKRQVLAEATRPGAASADLFGEIATLDGSLRDAAAMPTRLLQLEPELWKLAHRLQHRRRLGNVSLTTPRWPDRPAKYLPKSVFISGAVEPRFLDEVRGRGHDLLLPPTRGNYADERWTQLRGAGVALFWLGVTPQEGEPDPARQREERAQASYDLGMALVVGVPIVVAIPSGASVPFDVPVAEVHVDAVAPSARLADAVEVASFTGSWGQATTGGGSLERVLNELHRRYGARLAEGTTEIAWQSLKAADEALHFVHRLESLLTSLPGATPSVLFPAWALDYPSVPSIFHVTPFRKWSAAAAEVLREEATRRRIRYLRGDEALEQRIIQAIWGELSRATAVLADLTELNPNVAVELGIAHALGKPTVLVYNRDVDADRARELRLFESIRHDQVHAYSAADGYAKLRKALELVPTH